MANKDPSKTEEPTSKRLSEARADGNVLMSKEIVSVVTMAGSVVLLFWTVEQLAAVFGDILREIPRIDCTRSWTTADAREGAAMGALALLRILGVPMMGICVLSVVAIWGQIGVYMETKPLAWKLDKLNPANGIKKLMPSMENATKLGLALAKVLVIGVMVYLMVRDNLDRISHLALLPLPAAVAWMLNRLVWLLVRILVFFMIVAAVDYLYKRRQYYDNLKMSKQEVKDEHRNSEGDPKVKARQMRRMRELTMSRLVLEVPEADVVVVNPIHVAVALSYRPGSAAPRVVAKGLRKRAARIRALAREAGVPIVENPPLARALYRRVRSGSFISSEFFRAVAVILATLQRRKREQGQARGGVLEAGVRTA